MAIKMLKKALNKIVKLAPFVTIALIFTALLVACYNSWIAEEFTLSDNAPSADLYLWYSANEKVEHTVTCEPVFGDGGYFTPDVVMVKYFSLKNLSGESRRYNIHFELFQPNEEEREKPFLTEALEYQLQWDTKFGCFEWNEDITSRRPRFINNNSYTTNQMLGIKEVAAGEEVFFAVAIRMDSDAPIDYLNKKMFIDVGVSDLSD